MTPTSVEYYTGWKPGLIGNIVSSHAQYYAAEWGFGLPFETKVARESTIFFDGLSDTDLALSAWEGDAFLGSLIIDGNDLNAKPDQSHLRWFIVADQGRGVGRSLMERAMQFVDQAKTQCFLTTFRGLNQARGLYEKFGFNLTTEIESVTWGATVNEQRFDRPARNTL